MAKFTLCADFQKSLSVASSQDVEIKEQSFATRLRRGHFREAEMQLVSLGPSFRDLGFRQGFPIIERLFLLPVGVWVDSLLRIPIQCPPKLMVALQS